MHSKVAAKPPRKRPPAPMVQEVKCKRSKRVNKYYCTAAGQGNPRRIDWAALPAREHARINAFIHENKRMAWKAAMVVFHNHPKRNIIDFHTVFSVVYYTMARAYLRFDESLGWKPSTFVYKALLRAAKQSCEAQVRHQTCVGRQVPRQFGESWDKALTNRQALTPLQKMIKEEDDTFDRIFIRNFAFSLTARERHILISRFYFDRGLREVGEEVGLTKERIRQLAAGLAERLLEAWQTHRRLVESGKVIQAVADKYWFAEMIERHRLGIWWDEGAPRER